MVDFSVQKVGKNQQSNPCVQNSCDTAPQRPKSFAEVPDGLISKQCTEAMRAYTLVDNRFERQIDLKDYLANLMRQGKIPDKDFLIDKAYMPNYVLEILNKKGDPVKTLHYDGGTKAENLSGYEVSYYNERTGKMTRTMAYDMPGNKLRWRNDVYHNIPQERFTDCKMTKDTTPDDYIKLLESQGKVKDKDFLIDYNEPKDSEGNSQGVRSIRIIEYDSQEVQQKRTWWQFNDNDETANFVAHSLCNEKGEEYKRITFDPDNSVSIAKYNIQ